MSVAEAPTPVARAHEHAVDSQADHPVDHALAGAAVPVAHHVATGLIREWDRLAGPGPTLTATERITVAASARRVLTDPRPLPIAAWSPANVLAAHVASDSAGITAEIFDSFLSADLTPTMRSEIVGIAARVTAIDRFTQGVGTGLVRLPDPFSGDPTGMVTEPGDRETSAEITVPALSMFDRLPTELHAARDLAETLHGRPLDHGRTHDAGDPTDDTRLSVAQAAAVAARTAWLVECDVNLLIHARTLRRTVLNHQALHLEAIRSPDPQGELGVANGAELLALTDCLARTDLAGVKKARAALSIATSSRTTAEVIGVAAAEHLLARLANTGRIPRPPGLDASAWALGFDLADTRADAASVENPG